MRTGIGGHVMMTVYSKCSRCNKEVPEHQLWYGECVSCWLKSLEEEDKKEDIKHNNDDQQ